METELTINGQVVTADNLPEAVSEAMTKISDFSKRLGGALSAIADAEGKAAKNYDAAKQYKVVMNAHWWRSDTVNTKDSLMNLRKVLEDVAGNLHTVADCQKISDEVIADVLNYQATLADQMRFLYGVGVVNMTACQMVSKQIVERFDKGASDGDIDEVERKCLQGVLDDLRVQEENFRKFGMISAGFKNLEERLESKGVKDLEQDRRLAQKDRKDEEHDRRLNDKDKQDKLHDERIAAISKSAAEHECKIKWLEDALSSVRISARTPPLWLLISVGANVVLTVIALIVALNK